MFLLAGVGMCVCSILSLNFQPYYAAVRGKLVGGYWMSLETDEEKRVRERTFLSESFPLCVPLSCS